MVLFFDKVAIGHGEKMETLPFFYKIKVNPLHWSEFDKYGNHGATWQISSEKLLNNHYKQSFALTNNIVLVTNC